MIHDDIKNSHEHMEEGLESYQHIDADDAADLAYQKWRMLLTISCGNLRVSVLAKPTNVVFCEQKRKAWQDKRK